MLPKRKQSKEEHQLISFKLLVGRKFKTGSQSIDQKEYTISKYYDVADKFKVRWLDVQLGKINTALYDRRDLVRYFKEGSWVLQPKQTKRKFK